MIKERGRKRSVFQVDCVLRLYKASGLGLEILLVKWFKWSRDLFGETDWIKNWEVSSGLMGRWGWIGSHRDRGS